MQPMANGQPFIPMPGGPGRLGPPQGYPPMALLPPRAPPPMGMMPNGTMPSAPGQANIVSPPRQRTGSPLMDQIVSGASVRERSNSTSTHDSNDEEIQEVFNNNPGRYKTELCRTYMETGNCRYGFKCQFAHGISELRVISRHPKYKTEMCKAFHTRGSCPYGSRCRFIHSRKPGQDNSVLDTNPFDQQFLPVMYGMKRLRFFEKICSEGDEDDFVSTFTSAAPANGYHSKASAATILENMNVPEYFGVSAQEQQVPMGVSPQPDGMYGGGMGGMASGDPHQEGGAIPASVSAPVGVSSMLFPDGLDGGQHGPGPMPGVQGGYTYQDPNLS